MNKEELKEILENHKLWLQDSNTGKRANLHYADLSYADLRSANLISANLISANLSYANLSYTNLRSADLRSADLISANLSSADLSSADLDHSSWGLSCKTKEVKLCKKLQAQLLGHVMNVSPDVNYSKEQVQFVKDNWSRFEEFCNDKIKGLL